MWWGNCIFQLRRCGCGRKKSSSCPAASLLSHAIWPSPAPSACRQRFAGSGGRESSFLVLRREQKCLLRWCRPRRVACVSAEEKFNTLGGVRGTEGCACPGGEALGGFGSAGRRVLHASASRRLGTSRNCLDRLWTLQSFFGVCQVTVCFWPKTTLLWSSPELSS